MPFKVLFADDDAVIRQLAHLWLTKAGHGVVECDSADHLMDKIVGTQPDLILLDVLFGSSDGRKICQKLKRHPLTRHFPVILVSGDRTEIPDMVRGLRVGADDYLLKPLDPRLLLAKIKSVMQRFQDPGAFEDLLKKCGLKIRLGERLVEVGGSEVHLTRKEYDLFLTLVRNPNQVLTMKYLMETVWRYPTEVYGDPHTVEVHMSRLKKKLGSDFASRVTSTVGVGYRFKG
jgi:DNA-binding response OmpR family regulator